jgi:antitoxin HicB
MTDTQRYPLNVFWSDEDGGYIAVATDLPGCSAFGETQGEAIAEAQDAIASWIEAAGAAGNAVPAPSKPADWERYSGKVLVRMPKSLHASLARSAGAEGVSLNHFIVYLLSEGNVSAHRTDIQFSSFSNIGNLKLQPELFSPQQCVFVSLPRSATRISSSPSVIKQWTGFSELDVVNVKPGVPETNTIKITAALT